MKTVKMLLMGAAALVALAVAKPAHAGSILCTPNEVMVLDVGVTTPATARAHVRCTTTAPDGTNNIQFFAVPLTNAAYANRLITLATTAMTAGRPLFIAFTPGRFNDPSNVSFGCGSDNCRYPDLIALQ